MTKFYLSHRDASKFLRKLPEKSLSLIITDPAYESLEKHRKRGTTTRLKHSKASSNDWFTIFPNKRFPRFFKECFRVLDTNAHLYMFCDDETMFVVHPIACAAGFKFWKKIVWDYKNIGMGYHYRARHQNILFFEKGKRRLHDLSISDVLEVKRIHRGYPTEKPVGVSEVLVSQSSSEGDLVCDPFAGSGSVGVASVKFGRDFCGNDINIEALKISRDRMLEAGASRVRTFEELR